MIGDLALKGSKHIWPGHGQAMAGPWPARQGQCTKRPGHVPHDRANVPHGRSIGPAIGPAIGYVFIKIIQCITFLNTWILWEARALLEEAPRPMIDCHVNSQCTCQVASKQTVGPPATASMGLLSKQESSKGSPRDVIFEHSLGIARCPEPGRGTHDSNVTSCASQTSPTDEN